MNRASRLTILHYVDANGNCPLADWIEHLRDKTAAVQVLRRLNRVADGDLGDHKQVKGAKGIWELRIALQPGYRLYYAWGPDCAVFLCGGVKDTQRRDVDRARSALAALENFWRRGADCRVERTINGAPSGVIGKLNGGSDEQGNAREAPCRASTRPRP